MTRGSNRTATDFSERSDYSPFLEAGIASAELFTGAEAIKTEAEVALFGGQAEWRTMFIITRLVIMCRNLNVGAFIHNTKAIAHVVATHGWSFESLPPKASVKVKRALPAVVMSGGHDHVVKYFH